MSVKEEWKPLLWIVGIFTILFYLPVGNTRFDNSLMEALHLVKWYAREHVLLCLVPAFFIAGAIAVFISQASVMKYLGPAAKKVLAYGVSSVSGSILAVCSCTVLPLFAGIYRMGAGLGPASAFLYSGPAINVLAIILTARVLGLEIGVARAVGAILFSIIIGLLMHFFFRNEEREKAEAAMILPEPEIQRPLWQNVIYFTLMITILVFANWGTPREFSFSLHDNRNITAVVLKNFDSNKTDSPILLKITDGPEQGTEFLLDKSQIKSKTPVHGFSTAIWKYKWFITGISSIAFGIVLIFWFQTAWWKILLIVSSSIIAGFLIPNVPLIPFSVGIIGLSIVTGSGNEEQREWFTQTWDFAKQILPLLLYGVLFAGFFLGRPDHEGIIPSDWISSALGGNSLSANLFASVAGAFMYFATLTEVPILQGLIGAGMGKGPALALLLAGPALSLPNMLVIRSIMGTKKTIVFVFLVITMSTISGMIYGTLF